jgi:hypothetical protein
MAENARHLDQWLQEGIIAAKAGQLEQARFRLLDVVEQDPTNETAWYWLYQVFDRKDDQRICLENLIIINPQNQWAKQELLTYLETYAPVGAQSQTGAGPSGRPASTGLRDIISGYRTRPVTLKLVAAFWVGISIIFLSSGIIATGEWLISRSHSLDFPDQTFTIRIFELLISITFIVAGILGLGVASTIFLRPMVGFFGSILLALGLLLAGPTISLITEPPNYLTMICTGGISGMIVLLTLASQAGLKNSSQDSKVSN